MLKHFFKSGSETSRPSVLTGVGRSVRGFEMVAKNISKRIKSEWASIHLARNGSVIVGVKSNGTARCFHFQSLEDLKHGLDSKAICVKNWALCVPRQLCILKSLSLPACNLEEAAQMVEFELSSLIPIPTQYLAYGCTEVSSDANMFKVMVYILRLDQLNSHLEPYVSLGLMPSRILPCSLAIQEWCYRSVDDLNSEPTAIALIDSPHCQILRSVDGRLHKARSLALSGADIDANSRVIAQEILCQLQDASLSQKQNCRIILVASPDVAAGIKDRLTNQIGALAPEAVMVAEVPEIISCDASDSGLPHDANHDHVYGAVITAGLLDLLEHPKVSYLNLVPRDQLAHQARRLRNINYLWTSGLSILFVLFLWLCLLAMNWRIERASRQIEAEIAPIKDIAHSVETKRQQVKALQDQLSDRGQITKLIEELYRFTPKNISLSELDFVNRHTGPVLQIRGQADILANAFGYIEAMRDARLLKEMQIENAQQIAKPGGSIVEFRASCVVKQDE